MTRDEIIEMAEQAGVAFASDEYPDIWQTYMHVGKEELVAFAKLVAAKEREACAKVCDDIDVEYEGEDVLATWCSRAIRARGEQHE